MSSIQHTIDSARRLQALAAQAGHADIAERIGAEVVDALQRAEVTVAVIGEFDSGKSSLLNRLLDTDVLPVRPLPTTAKVTEIRPGARGYGFRFADGREVPLDEADFRAIAGGNRPAPGAGVVWMRTPHPLLGDRLCIVDTPGVESLSKEHDDITFGYLPCADAAIVAIDGEKGAVSEPVQSFLRDRVLKADLEKLVFAVNKCDLKPPSERGQVIEHIRRSLVTAGVPSPRVLAVSAEDPDPGPEALRRYLMEELGPAASAIIESRGRQRLEREAGLLLAALDAQRDALGNGSTEAIEVRLRDLRDARGRVAEDVRRLEVDVRSRLADLRGRIPRLVDALTDTVRGQAETYIAQCVQNKQKPDALNEKLSGWLARGLEHLSSAEIEPVLRDLTTRVGGQTRAIQARLPETAIAVPDGRMNPLLEGAIEIVLIAAINVVLPGGWIAAIVGRILGKGLLAPAKELIAAAITRLLAGIFDKGVSKGLTAAIGTHIDGLRSTLVDQIERQLDEHQAATLGAVRAHFDTLIGSQDKALADARDELRRGEAEARAKADAVRALADEVRRLVARR